MHDAHTQSYGNRKAHQVDSAKDVIRTQSSILDILDDPGFLSDERLHSIKWFQKLIDVNLLADHCLAYPSTLTQYLDIYRPGALSGNHPDRSIA
jgi:hypothetical protein